MKTKLIIFDCDGTLVDTEFIACQVFPKYWATHGVEFTVDEFKEKFIGTGKNAPIVVDTYSKMPASAHEEVGKIFSAALEKELTPVTGIHDLISSLQWETCVASNSSPTYIESVLRRTELYAHFEDRIFSAHQVKNPKPAPDVFLHAAATLGFRPDQCVVVEDSPAGVESAKAAGMNVIAFAAARHFSPFLIERLKATNPDRFCTSTKELKAALHRFLGERTTL